MKNIIIGDVHLGVHNLQIDEWLGYHKDYFYNFFIPKFEKNKYRLFILGDLFDNRTYMDLRVINFTLKFPKEL